MIAAKLRNLEEIVVQRILLGDMRTVAHLGTIVVIKQFLVIVGFRAAFIPLLVHNVSLLLTLKPIGLH